MAACAGGRQGVLADRPFLAPDPAETFPRIRRRSASAVMPLREDFVRRGIANDASRAQITVKALCGVLDSRAP